MSYPLPQKFPPNDDRFVYANWSMNLLPTTDVDVYMLVQYRFNLDPGDHDNIAEIHMNGQYEIMTGPGSRNAEAFLSGIKSALEDAGYAVSIQVRPRYGVAPLVEAPQNEES